MKNLKTADEQQVRAAFAAYTDADGLLTPYENPPVNSTGNGILYTSYYVMTLQQLGFLNQNDITQFEATLARCEVNEIEGLYNRSPEKTDREAPDDYLGLAAASGLEWLNISIAPSILNYGLSTSAYGGLVHFIYNNVDPGVFQTQSWFGRQPQVPAHFYLSNGKTPPLIQYIWWMVTVFLSGQGQAATNPNNWMLSWCLLATQANSKSMIMKLLAQNWWKRMNAAFPGGMNQCFSSYFQNPNHPLALYFVGDLPIFNG